MVTFKLNAAGEVTSVASATVNAVVVAVNTPVKSTTPAVDGSTIVPFFTESYLHIHHQPIQEGPYLQCHPQINHRILLLLSWLDHR